jgi:biotin transport system substrate-specific component
MFGDLEKSRFIAYSAAFVALITLGGWVSIPFYSVPFTLQTMFVLLAGIVMKRSAVVPVLITILLGVLGVPVFHNGIAGVGVLLGPTGGYFIGFIFAALITGLAYESRSDYARIPGIVAATIAIYGFGALWLMYSLGLGLVSAIVAGPLPFIPGDAVKAGVAYAIGKRLL